MDESFSIVLTYQGVEYNFETKLIATGYAHKFHVLINGWEVIYEPDEERNYRAIINQTGHAEVKAIDIDIELIKAVGAKIESLHEQ